MSTKFKPKFEKAIQKNNVRKLNRLLVKIKTPLTHFEPKDFVYFAYLAIKNHANECLKVLIDYGVSVNTMYSEDPLIHIAFEYKNIEAATYLIDKGANVKRVNYVDNTPLTLLIRKAPDLITEDLLLLLKEKGYDPQSRFSMPESDWEEASLNPPLFKRFKSVYGADYKSDMILDEAKESKDINRVQYILKEYLTRLGVFASSSGFEYAALLDYESELYLKMQLLKGEFDVALLSSYDLILVNLKTMNIASEYLIPIQNLLIWRERSELKDVYAQLSIRDNLRIEVSNRNICHIGWSYLFSKQFNEKQAITYFKEFKDFIETKSCVASKNRDIYRSLFFTMMGMKPSKEEITDFLNREFNGEDSKMKFESLFAIAFYIAGDTESGESFLRRAMESAKDPELMFAVEFEHFLSLILNDTMIKEINKATVYQ